MYYVYCYLQLLYGSLVMTTKILPPTKLEEYRHMVRRWKGCTKCPIGSWAHMHVFGRGDLDAQVVMVGEAPGRTEDALGIPFVGLAGRILDEALDKGKVEGVKWVITNLVACRPHDGEICQSNRTPNEIEMRNCRDRLVETIEIIKPKILIALGLTARENMPSLLKEKYRFFSVYHPSYILRNGGVDSEIFKKYVEELRRIMSYAKIRRSKVRSNAKSTNELSRMPEIRGTLA